MKPKLKPPGTKRLKLKCDLRLSISGFKLKLRRYTMEAGVAIERTVTCMSLPRPGEEVALVVGRGLHSSTFRLNLSALCGIGSALRGCSGGV